MTDSTLELIGKHNVLCGNKGAGKSNLLQWLIKQHPALENTLMYDMAREHEGLPRYIPTHRNGADARTEFGEVVRHFVVENDRGLRPDLLAVEEATRVMPNKGSVPDAAMDLVDLSRHYGTGLVAVCRRPAKLDTTVVELADNILAFSVRGSNDVKRLNAEAPGAGDAAKALDPEGFQCVRITPQRDWHLLEPVGEMDTTGEL